MAADTGGPGGAGGGDGHPPAGQPASDEGGGMDAASPTKEGGAEERRGKGQGPANRSRRSRAAARGARPRVGGWGFLEPLRLHNKPHLRHLKRRPRFCIDRKNGAGAARFMHRKRRLDFCYFIRKNRDGAFALKRKITQKKSINHLEKSKNYAKFGGLNCLKDGSICSQ